MVFFGREKELEILNNLTQKKTASLVVLKGRRRIGKSTLIEQFSRPYALYKFSGLAPTPEMTDQDQRDFFAKQFKKHFKISITAEDWWDLFSALSLQIAQIDSKQWAVILLDEISWMAGEDTTFLSKFKEAWDSDFKKKDKLILVLCGSVSSWIEKNIIGNTGFVGRVSLNMALEPLPLNICNYFFRKKMLSAYDKLKFLSITGGTPKYLEELNLNLSMDDNIKNLCFAKEGFLYNEFDQIFNDTVLSHAKVYKEIVLALASSGSLERSEIIEKIKLAEGGDLSDYLNNLITAGFISREYTWSLTDRQVSRFSKFRLSDNYLRFYLRAILPNRELVEKNLLTPGSLSSFTGWNSLIGLQFETLVINNKNLLIKLLGIDFNDVQICNPYFQKANSKQRGCQIDFLIQTKTNVLYVCEIKFSKNSLDSAVISEMKEKLQNLSVPKSFSVVPVLIHVNGVSESVIEADYFYKIIDFERFLLGV